MKKTAFLIAATLIGQSEAFSSTSFAAVGRLQKNSARRPNSALNDAALLDPSAGILQGGGADQMMIAAGGVAVAVAAAVAAMLGNSNKTGDTVSDAGEAAVFAEPEPIDVSIPYNAAAMLAFSETKLPTSKFEEFESLYIAKTVADVTIKKMARDVVEMEKVADQLAKDLEALSA